VSTFRDPSLLGALRLNLAPLKKGAPPSQTVSAYLFADDPNSTGNVRWQFGRFFRPSSFKPAEAMPMSGNAFALQVNVIYAAQARRLRGRNSPRVLAILKDWRSSAVNQKAEPVRVAYIWLRK